MYTITYVSAFDKSNQQPSLSETFRVFLWTWANESLWWRTWVLTTWWSCGIMGLWSVERPWRRLSTSPITSLSPARHRFGRLALSKDLCVYWISHSGASTETGLSKRSDAAFRWGCPPGPQSRQPWRFVRCRQRRFCYAILSWYSLTVRLSRRRSESKGRRAWQQMGCWRVGMAGLDEDAWRYGTSSALFMSFVSEPSIDPIWSYRPAWSGDSCWLGAICFSLVYEVWMCVPDVHNRLHVNFWN